MTGPSCVIVVPVYNEAQSLPVLIGQIEAAAHADCQFLLVDNGSTDPECARLLASSGQYWRGLRLERNIGFGGAIVAGARVVNAERVGWMPANLKVHPSAAARFAGMTNVPLGSLQKGLRHGRTLSAHVKTVLAGIAQSVVARTILFDTGGTPTICPRSFVLSMPNPPSDYSFESYVLFLARNLRMPVQRHRVKYGRRIFGNSHWQHGLKSELHLLRSILRQLPDWRDDIRKLL